MNKLKLKEHFDKELSNLLIKYASKGYFVICHTHDISDKIKFRQSKSKLHLRGKQ